MVDSEVETDEEAEPDVPTWRNSEEARLHCEISDQLSDEQRASLQQLLAEFKDTLQTRPGRTHVTEHSVHTGDE